MTEKLILDTFFTKKKWWRKYRYCKMFPRIWKWSEQYGLMKFTCSITDLPSSYWNVEKNWEQYNKFLKNKKHELDNLDWTNLPDISEKIKTWRKMK